MISKITLFSLVLGTLFLAGCKAEKQPRITNSLVDSVNIEYVSYQLDNGLTLLVHQDDKAPIVAVNIWYHVGSKDEEPGITGFAHLFEHLMFNGSENHPGEWFDTMEKIGATDLNGTTWFDRTNYFQTVPKNALDTVLWMESDRMGHFLAAVTQEVLDEQRDVVKNEKRQGENRPYGRVWPVVLSSIFPAGHPYSWSTIGSMEDLNAASLEDTHSWFKKYYGAANATLVVAGDVDPDVVFERVKHFFGHIDSGPALIKKGTNIAKRNTSTRDTMYDNVSHTRIYKVWNVAEFGTRDEVMLDIASDVLTKGKNSRLYKRLVHDTQLANAVSSSNLALEIAGIFSIQVTLNDTKDLQKVENIIDEELQEFFKHGPTKEEVQRVRNQSLLTILSGLDTVGGFSGKAQLLARYQTYLGDAKQYKKYLRYLEDATPFDVEYIANKWLNNGDYTLVVEPQPDYATGATLADRKNIPMPDGFAAFKAPEISQFTLNNGIKVSLIARDNLPFTHLRLLNKRGGYADDTTINGLAKFTASMLTEGSEGYTALEISQAFSDLGSRIAISASLDRVSASLTTLDNNYSKSLELFSHVIQKPTFVEDGVERVRTNILAGIKKEQKQPFSQALRVLPKLMFQKGHPYAKPLTGSGTEESIKTIKREHLVDFYNQFYAPSGAEIVVVSGIAADKLKQTLNQFFGAWKTDVSLQSITYADTPKIAKTQFYLLDKPESPQALIIAGQLLPKEPKDGDQSFEMALRVLGGNFNSRINMNLREDKGWAYGARALKVSTQLQQPLLYYASVQIDQTKNSILEILSEINGIVGDNPVSQAEIQRGQKGLLASLPGKFETAGDILGYLVGQVTNERSANYLEKYQANISKLTPAEVSNAAKAYFEPNNMVWVIVGDASVLEEQLVDLPFDSKLLLLTP